MTTLLDRDVRAAIPATGSDRRARGANLLRFCGMVLIVSSTVKFWAPAAVVDYMGSMGYAGATYSLIAGGSC